MPMHEAGGLWFGVYEHRYRSEISETVIAFQASMHSLPYALISGLDSGYPAKIGGVTLHNACQRTGAQVAQAPGGIALTTLDFVKLCDDGDMFYGYDEVWFGAKSLENACDLQTSRSPECWITQLVNGAEIPEGIAQVASWMAAHGAHLSLADGHNIGVVTNHAQMAADLDRLLTTMPVLS